MAIGGGRLVWKYHGEDKERGPDMWATLGKAIATHGIFLEQLCALVQWAASGSHVGSGTPTLHW
jgi:hypothetical protein